MPAAFDLVAYAQNPAASAWKVSARLFSNDVDVSQPQDVSSFSEAAFPGYKRLEDNLWAEVDLPGAGACLLKTWLLNWVNTEAAPVPGIWGLVFMATLGGVTQLIGFEKWPAPRTLGPNGGGLAIAATLTGSSVELQ